MLGLGIAFLGGLGAARSAVVPLFVTMWNFLKTAAKRVLQPSEQRRPMPSIGDPAPDFDALAHDGSRVKLAELRGRRVLLWFYPKADTPG